MQSSRLDDDDDGDDIYDFDIKWSTKVGIQINKEGETVTLFWTIY